MRSTSPNSGITRRKPSDFGVSSPGSSRSSTTSTAGPRAVYTVKLAGAVYVLHVFQKKSTRGISTPRREIELIKERYRWARAHHAAHCATHDGSQEDES